MACASWRVCTISGEPSGSQTWAYLAAERLLRSGRISPRSSGCHSSAGIETTRRSDRNSAR
jgi:hypothetical protein